MPARLVQLLEQLIEQEGLITPQAQQMELPFFSAMLLFVCAVYLHGRTLHPRRGGGANIDVSSIVSSKTNTKTASSKDTAGANTSSWFSFRSPSNPGIMTEQSSSAERKTSNRPLGLGALTGAPEAAEQAGAALADISQRQLRELRTLRSVEPANLAVVSGLRLCFPGDKRLVALEKTARTVVANASTYGAGGKQREPDGRPCWSALAAMILDGEFVQQQIENFDPSVGVTENMLDGLQRLIQCDGLGDDAKTDDPVLKKLALFLVAVYAHGRSEFPTEKVYSKKQLGPKSLYPPDEHEKAAELLQKLESITRQEVRELISLAKPPRRILVVFRAIATCFPNDAEMQNLKACLTKALAENASNDDAARAWLFCKEQLKPAGKLPSGLLEKMNNFDPDTVTEKMVGGLRVLIENEEDPLSVESSARVSLGMAKLTYFPLAVYEFGRRPPPELPTTAPCFGWLCQAICG